ncbi:MAG: type IX secretion system sortase PorU [Pseudoflavonifractor sp.]|nr:type IX secretion system sortase PorU [Alloprevotella sp.]MCM1117651.1 type IX secretion system sortase PorU [Pseudoflavonifractor sp.]
MKTLFTHILKRIIPVMALLMAANGHVQALPLDTYAARSVLADGRWVRVAVTSSGLVRITDRELRSYGFANPEAVKVYGYGGERISDRLDASTYVDDLPQTPSVSSAGSLVFYAQGPETITSTGTSFTHTLNPFSAYGYYYLSDYGDAPRLDPPTEGINPHGDGATSFTAHLFHELEEASLGESGHRLFGEDMRYTRSRSFTFPMPGRVEGSGVGVRVTIGTSISYEATLAIAANGEADPTPTRIAANAGGHNYGVATTATRTINPQGNSLALNLTLDTKGIVSAARLDAIDITYERELALPSDGVLHFTLSSPEGRLDCGERAEGVTIWDVTDIHHISRMDTHADGNTLTWRSPYGGGRRYAAWRDGATGFTKIAGGASIANQNLHGALSQEAAPDMVVIAPQPFMEQAKRIAALREGDTRHPLRVTVVDAAQAYNEFGSGAPDINALRRMLKMVYDRGEAAGRPLRFALLLGSATHDNRSLTTEMHAANRYALPTWESDESLSQYDSYTSDDLLMMLADGSGSRMSSDPYAIAVGRIPARSVADLAAYVDKLVTYNSLTDDRGWKNRLLFVSDDGNGGSHITQSESQLAAMLASDGGSRMMPTKAYVDAFPLVGGSCDGARERQMRTLDDGAVWWNYIGHAAKTSLTSENMLSLTDISTLYLRRLPFFYGATCSFARWDGADPSGLELLAFNAKGGIIAGISATREVYIEQNQYFSDAIGAEAFVRRADGSLPTIGEFFQAAKNRLAAPAGASNTNKLRYVLLGDPSMHLATPAENIKVATIAGIAADESAPEPPVIMARQQFQVTGRITDPSGRTLDSFNGFIGATIYDAEYSTTSTGRKTPNDGEGKQITFEEQGGRLFAGRDTVAAGQFRISVAMPDQVADNFRPAAISLYAVATDSTEATGLNRNFYVYGYDETADMDLTAPVIEYAYLNHQSFKPGEAVNPSPMFIAKVSDNVGINLSTAGVGRQLSLTLDDTTPFTDLTQYYTPATDGTNGGTIAYPLADIPDGHHTLLFRVYDTSGNVARQEIDFAVSQSLAPKLFEVFSDANPARTAANFYVRHDRPDATLDVTIAIYNLLGHMVWTSTSTDRSDMFLSAPMRWDLRDMGGRRVSRGIYIYRVTATGADGKPQSVSGKIAVAAQ